MEMSQVQIPNIAILPILVFLWGMFILVFWMYVAWRAMRAHEKLAKAVEDIPKSSSV